MKISLIEAKKLATPGKLRVSYEPSVVVGDIWTLRAPEDGDSPAGGTTASAANAALLAHCWNTHDELVEALEKAIELASMEDADYYKADDAGEVERVKAVLARAKTVVMP